jgi:hypothetical protein
MTINVSDEEGGAYWYLHFFGKKKSKSVKECKAGLSELFTSTSYTRGDEVGLNMPFMYVTNLWQKDEQPKRKKNIAQAATELLREWVEHFGMLKFCDMQELFYFLRETHPPQAKPVLWELIQRFLPENKDAVPKSPILSQRCRAFLIGMLFAFQEDEPAKNLEWWWEIHSRLTPSDEMYYIWQGMKRADPEKTWSYLPKIVKRDGDDTTSICHDISQTLPWPSKPEGRKAEKWLDDYVQKHGLQENLAKERKKPRDFAKYLQYIAEYPKRIEEHLAKLREKPKKFGQYSSILIEYLEGLKKYLEAAEHLRSKFLELEPELTKKAKWAINKGMFIHSHEYLVLWPELGIDSLFD